MRWGKTRAGVCAVALVLAAAVVSIVQATPAGAAALTNVSWSVSNNQVSATNVTYAYSFKTATTGTIKTITFLVSGAGLAGAPAIAKNYGIGAGTVARAGQTITYTVTSAVSVSTGIPIYIEFSGLTNPGTAGSYTTTITTQTSAPATIDTTAFELDMDPSLPALADQSQTVGLTVLTNANSGYTLTVSDNAAGLQSTATGTPTIADASTGKATSVTWPGAPKFGYTVTGTGAAIDAAFTGSKYSGYVAA